MPSRLCMCSYDASAHLTEETRSASKSGPRGIIMTVVVSFLVGWMYLLSLTFSIQARYRAAGAVHVERRRAQCGWVIWLAAHPRPPIPLATWASTHPLC